jgi:hypothetical protein
MPGIRSISQAKRAAILRLNHYTLEDVTGQIGVFDYGLNILPGDIVADHRRRGPRRAEVPRALRGDEGPRPLDLALPQARPGLYTNAVVTTPTTPSTLPPDANSPPAVTGLWLLRTAARSPACGSRGSA